MLYQSTRGGIKGVSYEDAICSGYAADGGLFVPECLPQVNAAFVTRLASLPSFQDVAVEVLRLFIPDSEIPFKDLKALVFSSFLGFDNPANVIPVVPVSQGYIAELFHGPTQSFKDFGQQLLVAMVDYFAAKRGRRHTLVVATTGDTGPAAISAVARSKALSIVCGYPKGQISRLQELQMTTVDHPNVKVYAFEGAGDDMDSTIKKVTTDGAFASKYNTAGVNSINLARVTAQICHFFWIYLRAAFGPAGKKYKLQPNESLPIVVACIPTGAMGNVMAGYFCKLIGIPLALSCAVNENNIVHRAATAGIYEVSKPMVRTLSEAINCQCPYNMERMLYYVSGQDSQSIKQFYDRLVVSGSEAFPERWQQGLAGLIRTGTVSDEVMLHTISSYQSKFGYLADPHTAVALAGASLMGLYSLPATTLKHLTTTKGYWPVPVPSVSSSSSNGNGEAKCPFSGGNSSSSACPAQAAQSASPNPPVVVLSTAHPCKFEEAISKAISVKFWRDNFVDEHGKLPAKTLMPPSAAVLYSRPEVPLTVFRKGEDWERNLRDAIVRTAENAKSPKSKL